MRKKPSNINIVTSILYPSLKINHSKLKSLKSLVFNTENSTLLQQSNSSFSAKKKFVKIALAHLYSKKKTCENRSIMRGIRCERGGVVDFAYKGSTNTNLVIDIKKKVNSKLKDNKGYKSHILNLKDRVKAAKTIQEWWRIILNKFSLFCVKIVKIQSTWRGYLIRYNLFEYLYYRIVSVSIFKTLKKVVKNLLKNQVMAKLQVKFANLFKEKLLTRIQKKFKKFIEVKRKKRPTLNSNHRNKIYIVSYVFILGV